MAKKPTFDYDLIVIGSGAAGSPAATIAAALGTLQCSAFEPCLL